MDATLVTDGARTCDGGLGFNTACDVAGLDVDWPDISLYSRQIDLIEFCAAEVYTVSVKGCQVLSLSHDLSLFVALAQFA